MKFIKNVIFLLVFIVFWNGLSNIQIGGDDSKLYYYFPYEYINNFSKSIITTNQPGSLGIYFSQTYTYVSIFIIGLISSLLRETDVFRVLLFSNLLLSYLFFKKLALNLIDQPNHLIIDLSALAFSFSIFTYYTVWSHQLFSLYLTSYFPCIFYLFVKYMRNKKIKYIFFALLCSVIYSFTFFSIAWILSTLLVLSPFALYYLKLNAKSFIKGMCIFVAILMLLNAHWLFHFVNSAMTSDDKSDVISQSTSDTFQKNNEYNILAVTRNNTLFYPLNGLFHKNIQFDFGWKTYNIYMKYYINNIYINVLFLLNIVIAYIIADNKKDKYLFIAALSSWLIALYLFTVRIGNWGIQLFLLFNQVIPGFTMFRNMYDKFGIAMALSTSLLLAISSSIVLKKIKKKKLRLAYSILLSVYVCINILPFVRGDLFNISFGNSTVLYNRLTETKTQIQTILNGFNDIETNDRILWWPLNIANYVIVKDKYLENQVYAGVSPISLLTPHLDFTGMLSFNEVQQNKINQYLKDKDYIQLGYLFKSLDIKYIAKYNFRDNSIINSYLYSVNEPGDLYRIQNEAGLYKELLGEEIKTVGDYYILYKISEKYSGSKIYLTSKTLSATASGELTYKKVNPYTYKIVIKELAENSNLVFLDPYHKKWIIRVDNRNDNQIAIKNHTKIFDYANQWEIYSLKNDKDIELTLYFQPHDYYRPMIIVSMISTIVVVLLSIYHNIVGQDEKH